MREVTLIMSRKRNAIDTEELQAVKVKVQSCLPFPIQYAKDCLTLSLLIFEVTKLNISANTLRRLWGFESTSFSPAYSTIEILQKFVALKGQRQELSSMAQFVIDFYQPLHFETIGADDKTFQASCRKIALLLKEQPTVFDEFKGILAKSELGRKFFYELFPDYDWLMKGLLDGYRDYLQFSTSRNDRLFGLSIFFYHAYLTNNKSLMINYAAEIRETWERVSGDVHPFVLGRCFFAFLYTAKPAHWSNILGVMWLEERSIPRGKIGLFREFPGFHYFVCDALYQREDFVSLYQLTKSALEQFSRSEEFAWKGYYDQLKVYQAAALWKMKKKADALNLFKTVDTSNYYFISRNYYVDIHRQVQELLGVL